MKTITISTENNETYSAISNFFIDYYMTDANGEFVKVYLYLVRLLQNKSAITVAGIADHFNLTEKDICRAIKYWISKGTMKFNYDGHGKISGIVLLPLTAPEVEPQLTSDDISILTSEATFSDKNSDKADAEAITKETTNTIEAKVLVGETVPSKKNFTPNEVSSKEKDDDFQDIIYQCQALFKNELTPTRINTLIYIYDILGFGHDLTEYLIIHCATLNKTSCRYMEAVAIEWYKDGVTTVAAAKERVEQATGITSLVFKSLGFGSRKPTDIERQYMTSWIKDFAFSQDIIKAACDKAILIKPNSATIPYVNGILENWNKSNVKTLKDVEALDKDHKDKKSTTTTPKNSSSNISNFNEFKQTKLDAELDEMERLLLQEVNR